MKQVSCLTKEIFSVKKRKEKKKKIEFKSNIKKIWKKKKNFSQIMRYEIQSLKELESLKLSRLNLTICGVPEEKNKK